jgi:hypothetical protein
VDRLRSLTTKSQRQQPVGQEAAQVGTHGNADRPQTVFDAEGPAAERLGDM